MIIQSETQKFLDKFGFEKIKDYAHFASFPPVADGTRYVEINAAGTHSEIRKHDYCPPSKVSMLINLQTLYATRGKENKDVGT